MDWLKQIAPTIASALGGPLVGLAYEAISKVLNISPQDAKSIIEDGKLTSDQIAQIKIAEINLKNTEDSLGLNFESLAVQDRKSARDMQSQTKSIIPAVLSVGITIGFFGILIALMNKPDLGSSQALMIMLGSLGTAWVSIIAFWFGSTHSGQRKDEMIYNSSPTQ